MSIGITFITTTFALFTAGLGLDALAQQRKDGPCAADAKKFCGNVQAGRGAIAKCMKAHEAELSPACQGELKARAERARQVREECRPDVEKFCKGVAPGGGRILSCLRARQAELAPACAADLKRRGDRRPRAQ